jgi:hypothetical protein
MGGPFEGDSNVSATPGLTGKNTAPPTPRGQVPHGLAVGVAGSSVSGYGVVGEGHTGVLGTTSDEGSGVWGQSGGKASVGVYGNSDAGVGVTGQSGSGPGVQGISNSGVGVLATSSGNNAIQATGTADVDVIGVTSSSKNHAGVSVFNNSGGYALSVSSMATGGQGGIGIFCQRC